MDFMTMNYRILLRVGGVALAFFALAAGRASAQENAPPRPTQTGEPPRASRPTPHESKLEGRRSRHTYTAKRYNPGAVFDYTVYVSKHYKQDTPAALLIQFDMFNAEQTAALEALVEQGQAPAFVVIAGPAGRLEPTVPEGKSRGLRVENYDHVGPEFPNFLVEELIPEATKVENLSISPNPDLHMTSGGSSGGQCAFNACWYRNDYFRRAYIASPSVFALTGADEFFTYAQRCEPRPIRVYMTFNEFEPVGYWGNNYEVGLAMVRFLKLSGYEFMWQYFPKTGHTWGIADYDTQLKALGFIWKDWDSKPLAVGDYSRTLGMVVEKDSPWTAVGDRATLPTRVAASVEQGTYAARGGEIWLSPKAGNPRKVADGFHDLSSLAVSSDRWRLYIGDKRQRYLLSMTIAPDGSLKDLRKVNVLLIATNSVVIGAQDIAVDTQDRIYAATDAGIQVATPGTYTQMILPLHGDLPADKVVFDGQTLYAGSGDRIFKRHVKVPGRTADSPISPPVQTLDLKMTTHPFLSGDYRQP
jgi:enterochelin esterase-like enzyme